MTGRLKGTVGICMVMLALVSSGSRRASAQCTFEWRPGDPIPGVDGSVSAMTKWDPDGSGPQPELVVVGGYFRVAGSVVALNIAAWDGSSWQALGGGANDAVFALAVHENMLIAGGRFTTIGGVSANRIARWDGVSWQPLGEGFDDYVLAIQVYEDRIVAGGIFDFSGDVEVNAIAQWSGESWESMAGGFQSCPTCTPSVTSFAVYQGALIVGGGFLQAGNVPASGLARWDGAAWQEFGGGCGGVWALTTDGTRLYAGGEFTSIGGIPINRVAYWDGGAWNALGDGINAPATTVHELFLHDGEVIAGGNFGYFMNQQWHIIKWNGATWQPVGDGRWDRVDAMIEHNGDLIAGGFFQQPDGRGISRWDGSQWHPLNAGTVWEVRDLFSMDGQLFGSASLSFTQTYVVQRTESGWVPVGEAFNGRVNALGEYQDQLVAVGEFTQVGSALMSHVALWDGKAWQPVGGGTNAWCHALTVFNGDLFVAGSFSTAGGVQARCIARWDGAAWHSLGAGIGAFLQTIYALAIHDDVLIAGGQFSIASVSAWNIARWDGTAWSALGLGIDSPGVRALATFNGDLIAGGKFFNSQNVARWDGTAWLPVAGGLVGGSGEVRALLNYNGDLIAAGSFNSAGGVAVDSVARWNGQTWSSVDQVVGLGPSFDVFAYALAAHGRELVMGGNFALAGDAVSAAFARYGPSESCPADIAPSCGDGSVNVNDLLAVITRWGPCENCVADMDSDGVIAVNDLLEVLAHWGACP